MSLRQANILDASQPTLPPLVWDDPSAPEPKLRPQHAHFITSHIYKILEHGGYPNPHEWLHLYLTGSLCTYQYGDNSDCDISVFVISSKLPEWSRAEMIGLMIEGTDGVTLPGTPYELQAYVVARGIHPGDLYRPGLRPGYDIAHHKWISPPDHRLVHDVKAQENGFYAWALQQSDKMEKLLRYEPDKAVDFWHQIHRKRIRDERDGKGDYSESNILYKLLFKRGLTPEIAGISGEHISKKPILQCAQCGNTDGMQKWGPCPSCGLWRQPTFPSSDTPWSRGNHPEDYPNRPERNPLTPEGTPYMDMRAVQNEGWLARRASTVSDEPAPMGVVQQPVQCPWCFGQHPHGFDTNQCPRRLELLRNQAPMSFGPDEPAPIMAKVANLQGLPGPVNVPGHGPMQFGTNPDIERIANEYNQANGLGEHPTDYLPIQPQISQQIAQEYGQMPHNPQDPTVASAYQQLANESMAQYNHAVQNGYNFEFYPQGQDPYPNSPREAVMDIQNNKHMYVYPTAAGYGQDQQGMDHPLLGDSGVRWNGQPVTHNDIFRAIHDFYGHAKEGLGFRHHGEDNAYRQHAAMFSPLAQRALASETRGQNSWVNFGPHGDTNQSANQADTVYAPQKAGLLPEWVTNPDLHRPTTVSKVAASSLAESVYDATIQQGGITMGLGGEQPNTGYAFPPSKSEEQIVASDVFSPDDIDHFIADRYKELHQPGHYLGTWLSNGQVYLDVSIIEPDYQKAHDMATESNQLAMYHLDSGQDIPIEASAPATLSA